MLNFLSALVTAFLMPVHAADVQSQGKWISKGTIFNNGAVLVKLGFDFKDDDTVDMSTICYYPTREIEAVVTVPFNVAAGKISFLGGGTQTVKESGMECISTSQAGVVDYTINENVLRVSAGGQFFDYVRR